MADQYTHTEGAGAGACDIDEKWFYTVVLSRKRKLPFGRPHPRTRVVHKKHIPKVIFHGDVKSLAALTDDSEFSLAAYFDVDGQDDFVSQGDMALAADIRNVHALAQDFLQHVTPPSRDFLGDRLLEVYMLGFLQPIDVLVNCKLAPIGRRTNTSKTTGKEYVKAVMLACTVCGKETSLQCVTCAESGACRAAVCGSVRPQCWNAHVNRVMEKGKPHTPKRKRARKT